MKRIWQKAKKATAFLLAVMLVTAMCPVSFATTNTGGVREYFPGTTSDEKTFTSVVTTSSSPQTNSYDSDVGCISITKIRYDRMKDIKVTNTTNGYAQYNAFRLTGLEAGEYKISFKNAAQDENAQKASAAPAVYFFKAKDEYKTLDEYKATRGPYLSTANGVDLTNDILGYFNFAKAERNAYTTFKNDAGKDVILKVTEPGDYYIVFSYVPNTWEIATHFRYYYTTAVPQTKAEAVAFIATEGNSSKNKNYYLELHIGGIKLEKLASEAAPTTLSYIVRGDNVEVSAENYTPGNVGSWTVDTSFTATATGSDFAYWANGNGTPVSEEPSYTFTPKSNFVLEAVYAPADTATKKVQFWNYNKVYLGDKGVTADNKVESMPENPTLNGWSFDKWTTDGDDTFDANTAITDAITRVVAQFTSLVEPFTVDGANYSYDDEFEKTAASASEGQVFSHWTINNQVASYAETLSFNVWNTVSVAAVYADEKPEVIPTVVLDKVNADEYFIHYEVPAGYTPVDAGIVFSENGTPSINSADSKASVKNASSKGQFTAAPGEDTHIVARGYVMYKDAAGNYRIIYSAVK